MISAWNNWTVFALSENLAVVQCPFWTLVKGLKGERTPSIVIRGRGQCFDKIGDSEKRRRLSSTFNSVKANADGKAHRVGRENSEMLRGMKRVVLLSLSKFYRQHYSFQDYCLFVIVAFLLLYFQQICCWFKRLGPWAGNTDPNHCYLDPGQGKQWIRIYENYLYTIAP